MAVREGEREMRWKTEQKEMGTRWKNEGQKEMGRDTKMGKR